MLNMTWLHTATINPKEAWQLNPKLLQARHPESLQRKAILEKGSQFAVRGKATPLEVKFNF